MNVTITPRYLPTKPTVALVGAGAVGLVIVAAFARAGWDVYVCGARALFEQIAVEEGERTQSYPVRHVHAPAELGACTVAVVAVKAHQTGAVADWLRALNRRDMPVLLAQNGLEHCERLATYAPMAAGMPAVVYFNAARLAPGRSVLRRIGEVDLCLPASTVVHKSVVALQKGGLRVVTAADMTTVVWSKLLTNSAANPLTALSGQPTGVMRAPAMLANARQIMTEVVQVGQAEGAALTERHVEQALAWLQTIPPESMTSMLQDRLAGRTLEYDAITGAIVRAAERHALDVPLNRFMLGLLSAIRPSKP